MMQPILTGPADLFLSHFMKAVRENDDEIVFSLAEDCFAIDVVEPFKDEDGNEIPFAKDDAETMIEGRLLEAMARVGLAQFKYIDHETFEPDPKPGPALEEGILRLAATLYDHVYGLDGYAQLNPFDENDAEYITNYVADARELVVAYPHLLSAHERGLS